jgi:hypothetical protein
MSTPYQQLVSSPVLGATTAAAVVVGAAYIMYARRGGQGGSVCPVRIREGSVEVADMHASSEERRRDFFRFYKSKSVYIKKSRGGDVSVFRGGNDEEALRSLVKLLPRGTDIDALVYSLSTSIGMEVLLKLGVMPPMISQPLFVVHTDTGDVDLFGFIGPNVRGDGGPESKYTDWMIQITACTNILKRGNKVVTSQVKYFVKERPHNCTRTSDFI